MKKHITAESLKRMNKLAGLIKEDDGGVEGYPDFQKNIEIDWEDVARDRKREIIGKIESEFGPENVYSGVRIGVVFLFGLFLVISLRVIL